MFHLLVIQTWVEKSSSERKWQIIDCLEGPRDLLHQAKESANQQIPSQPLETEKNCIAHQRFALHRKQSKTIVPSDQRQPYLSEAIYQKSNVGTPVESSRRRQGEV